MEDRSSILDPPFSFRIPPAAFVVESDGRVLLMLSRQQLDQAGGGQFLGRGWQLVVLAVAGILS